MKALLVLPFALASIAAMAFVPSTKPLDGWHAFTALCSAHGGPTDAVRMQQWNGQDFASGDTWRVECGDVEVVIPNEWYDAGMDELNAKEHDKT